MQKNKFLIVCGDYCPINRYSEILNNDITIFSELSYFEDDNYKIFNLEAPIIDKASNPSYKTGPNLYLKSNALNPFLNMKNCIFSLANNHIMDFGDQGLENTIKECDKRKIKTFGAGLTSEKSSEPLIIKINDKKIGLINIAEKEFGISINTKAGYNYVDEIKNYYEIKNLKSIVDYVIVIYHGGHEYNHIPSPNLVKRLRYLSDIGADYIICHHSHVYSGYEFYNNKYIFYGLGNFVFDWPSKKNNNWKIGYYIKLDFEKPSSFEIIPYKQDFTSLKIIPLEKHELMLFNENLNNICSIINDEKKMREKWLSFISQKEKKYLKLIFNKLTVFRLMVRKKYLKVNKFRKYLILNLIRNESHSEIIKEILIK